MATVKRLLDAIRKLPPKERRQLVAALRPQRKGRRSPARTREPMTGAAGLLALVGIGHSDYADVSTNKYKHLGEIYASQP